MVVILGALFAGPLWAMLPITELLTHDLYHQIIRFKWIASQACTLKKVQLHFLESSDCQSGYLKPFNSEQSENEWMVSSDQKFGLQGDAVYQAAASVVSFDEIERIHSILIRLQTPHKQYIYYKGGCNDQGLNCCVPIACSSIDQTCRATFSPKVQSIYLRTMV